MWMPGENMLLSHKEGIGHRNLGRPPDTTEILTRSEHTSQLPVFLTHKPLETITQVVEFQDITSVLLAPKLPPEFGTYLQNLGQLWLS